MSYRANRENAGLDAELARLEAQAALSWAAEARRLRAFRLPDRPRILELGAGPGCVTTRLHDLFPGCTVTALDDDEEMLAHARTRCAGREGITLTLADAAATGLAEASFDLVVSRYLFQHLARPELVAAEALRVLRAGGLHAIIDIDDELWGLAEPRFPALQAIQAKASAAQGQAGRNRRIGRSLRAILEGAGYADPALDVFCYGSDWLGLEPFAAQMDPSRLLPLVRDGGVSMSEYLAAQAMTDAFTASPGARVLLLGFIGSGRRPS